MYVPFTRYWSLVGHPYKFILHKHKAKRAGLHYDLRIQTDSGHVVASLASRKLLPHLLEHMDRVVLFEQDPHSKTWLNEKLLVRDVGPGYGSGKIYLMCWGFMYPYSIEDLKITWGLKVEYSVVRYFNKGHFSCFTWIPYRANMLLSILCSPELKSRVKNKT